MSQPQAESRPWWLGFAVILMGGLWIWGSLKLEISDRLSGLGPGAFVLIVGAALVLLGLILLWQIARGERFEPEDTEDALADAPVSYPALASVGLAVFLPALIMPYLGFPITGMISFMLIAWALGSKKVPMNLAIGAVLSAFAWYGFTNLGVQLGAFFPFAG
ncbi:MAG TPA: tripartite tricarboxylate transporter TctB family protein [Mesorhizobium sp.]|jgi:putative tricarboxylic transport membrane protein